MRKFITTLIAVLITCATYAQTFSYSGYIYNANGTGAVNVPVKLYKRTTPVLTGFTSQTNYNGHSYYRSVAASTWTVAKAACEAMNGHLVTMSNAAENSFVFSQWNSGWIGYYQDKTGAFYGEPNAGWRWTENYAGGTQQADYDVASYTSGSTLTDIKSSLNATLYNSPTYTSTGGKYITFNGSTQYAITGNLASKFPSSAKPITIQLWAYPTENGVLVSELGTASPSSGWHESVIEITGSNTLRVGLWNTSGAISQLSTSITLNTWHLIGITYDGTSMKGYLDGTNFGTLAFARDVPHAYGGNGEYFALGLSDATNMGDGTYANYRLGRFDVFNTALTADEMNRNWMSTAWRFGRYPYSNWNGGEPNDAGGEDFIQFVGGGLWNDLPNTYSYQYVLEFDYIVTTTPWVLFQTVYTNSSGYYSFSQSTNPSVEWYIQVDAPTPVTIHQTSDLSSIGNIILGSTTKKSLHWNMFDVNNDGKITISDAYYVSGKKNGIFPSWIGSQPSALYTTTQFNALNSGTTNLKATYPGVSSFTITSPVSGGSTNYYLIAPGYAGQVTY